MSVKIICRTCWGMTYVGGQNCPTCKGQGELVAGDSVWTDVGKTPLPPDLHPILAHLLKNIPQGDESPGRPKTARRDHEACGLLGN